MPEYALMPESYSLFPYNFLIILVCLLFIHASIHNNLSAGAQNVIGAYVIMLVYRRLLTLQALVNNTLTWQSSCVIANNA